MALPSDESALDLAVKALLKAANHAAWHAADIAEEDEDDKAVEYFERHANLLRELANEWKPPRDGWGKVVPYRGPVPVKSLPPDRGR